MGHARREKGIEMDLTADALTRWFDAQDAARAVPGLSGDAALLHIQGTGVMDVRVCGTHFAGWAIAEPMCFAAWSNERTDAAWLFDPHWPGGTRTHGLRYQAWRSACGARLLVRRRDVDGAVALTRETAAFIGAAGAHAINNPLTWMNGHVAFLADELSRGADAELAEMASELMSGVAQVTHAVRDLRALLDPPLRARRADLSGQVARAAALCGADLKHRIAVTTAIAPGLLSAVNADVVTALVVHALRWCAADVPSGNREPAGVHVSLERAGDRAVLRIEGTTAPTLGVQARQAAATHALLAAQVSAGGTWLDASCVCHVSWPVATSPDASSARS